MRAVTGVQEKLDQAGAALIRGRAKPEAGLDRPGARPGEQAEIHRRYQRKWAQEDSRKHKKIC